MTLVSGIVLLLAVITLVPMWVLIAELAAALLPDRAAPATPAPWTGPLVLLMPAHDEASGIGPVIERLKVQMRADDRLLVVADNCSDDTAAIARAAGAEVIERTDADHRGKGYALDYGIRHLRDAPPDQVVIVDADCDVSHGALEALRLACSHRQVAVQGLYLMYNTSGAGLKQRVSAFAWLVKNRVRPRGAAALGWPCPLMGTGMAFPWSQLVAAKLASGNLVEDMQLGIDLAIEGHAPIFCEEALVTSRFPTDSAAAQTQRTRWEHGHLTTLVQQAPRLLRQGLARRQWSLIGMALDLAVPPLSLTMALSFVMLMVAGSMVWLGGPAWPALLIMSTFVIMTAVLLAVWSRWGRQTLSIGDFLRIPIYVLGKIGIYRKFVTGRQKDWVRTERK